MTTWSYSHSQRISADIRKLVRPCICCWNCSESEITSLWQNDDVWEWRHNKKNNFPPVSHPPAPPLTLPAENSAAKPELSISDGLADTEKQYCGLSQVGKGSQVIAGGFTRSRTFNASSCYLLLELSKNFKQLGFKNIFSIIFFIFSRKIWYSYLAASDFDIQLVEHCLSWSHSPDKTVSQDNKN